MATISMESLWNFLNSISLTKQNKLWLAEHLYEEVKDGEEEATAKYDDWGIPCPANREEAMQLIDEIEEEDKMAGEVPIEELLEETRKFINEHEH